MKVRRESVLALSLVTINLVMMLSMGARAARRTEESPVCEVPRSAYLQTPYDGKTWKVDDMAVEGVATVRDVFSNRALLVDRGELMFVYIDDSAQPRMDLKPGERVFVRGTARCCATFRSRNPNAGDGDYHAVTDRRTQPDYLQAVEVRPIDR